MTKALELARAQPDSLKGRILAAARRSFARQGYRGTSTRTIAGEAGIDVSTLYYHWGSKLDLFDAVLADVQLGFEARLRAWVHATRDRTLDECLDLGVEHFAGFFMDRDVVRVALYSFFDEEFAGKGWAVASQRQLVETLRTFVEKRFGAAAVPEEFDAAVLALIASILALVGSKKHVADILGLDPDGPEYHERVVRTLRRLIGSFARSFESKGE